MLSALVVLSGGADSTLCTFWAKSKFDDVHCISFDYGQSHSIELAAARKVAELAGAASHEIINLHRILKSTSPLVNPKHELETYSDFETMSDIIGDRVELTFVPARNSLFLVIALNRAVDLNCSDIVTGVCSNDHSNYPDCQPVFIADLERALNTSLGQGSGLSIHTPLMFLSKSESVRLALTLDGCYAALGYSHTAYSGEYPPVTQDHATVLRAQGFFEAGIPDPLIVRAWWERKLAKLPETENYTMYHRFLGIPSTSSSPRDIHSKLYNLELYLRGS